MMGQRMYAWHTRGDGYQAVDLFYIGGNISMLVVLPDRKNDLEGSLTAPAIRQCVLQIAAANA